MLENNTAFIDGANLYNGIRNLGWKFDYTKFREWLRAKYNVNVAYLFLGLIPKYQYLYTKLRTAGYVLVFKDVIFDSKGKAKGNCDTDLVVLVIQEAYENKFDKAILVSSDGDFAPLIKFLIIQNKFHAIVSTHEVSRCSVLLKRTNVNITYISDQRSILET